MGLFNRTKTVDIFFIGCDGTEVDRGIYSFYLNVNNGELIKKSFVKSLANPIALSRAGRWMYITYRNGTGAVTDGGVWQYACMELQLGLAARVHNEGKTYTQVIVSPDKTHAYAIDYYNGEIITMPILKSKLVRVSETKKLEGKGIDPIKQTESHPSQILFTPDDRYVVVLDMGGDTIHVYTLNEKGYLQEDLERTLKTNPGTGPRKMIFSKDKKYAYCINEITSTITTYAYHDGHFTLLEEKLTYIKEDFEGVNVPTDIVMTEDNQYIAVTNKGDDTIVLFERGDDGLLKRKDLIETDAGPVALEIFRDRWLVVVSKQGGSVESFEIRKNEKRGILFETHSAYALHAPTCIAKGAENLRVV